MKNLLQIIIGLSLGFFVIWLLYQFGAFLFVNWWWLVVALVVWVIVAVAIIRKTGGLGR